ncbi:MAG: hypothetical protein IKC87_01915 [Clostridia bacterium]|nr:hypothetical protein [Clostridia bacterium]
MRKIAALGLVMILIFNILSLTACRAPGEEGEYTYRTYTSALGNNWNPHTWETSADRAVMEYLTTPLVSILPLDSLEGSYQWSFDMAKRVTDVTAGARGDLTKYNVKLGTGVSVNDVDKGYVFEIELREGLMFENGNEITADDFIESMKLLLDPRMKNNRANLYVTGESALAGASAYFGGNVSFESVGCYKTGELSFRYVTESYLDYNYFLASLTSHWLVDTEIYNKGLISSGELVSTDYGTSVATTSSFGPYRIESHQGEKELVLVRNERWYGWQKDDNGDIFSYTSCEVDGELKEQYMTTKVVISVMDSATAKQSFLRGELSEWAPSASEYNTYRYSDGLYRTNETYTMSLFFNSNKDALLSMDRSKGNVNSVVLSSDSFRRGMSLAIDRDEFALATEGYRPQYALLNDMYYYDIYDDPTSRYRDTPEAKAALCRLYGLSYGDGATYKTLDDAYRSITGYDIGGAEAEFKRAFEELTESGLYRAGEEIKIRVAWAKGALSADDNQQVALLERHINLALSDSGFGKLTLVPVARVSNRYAAVPNGEFAMGYGAWGGAAFYPFRNLLVYMDPEYENLNEAACWSPETETFTLTVDGVERTMTYQAWARSLTGSGEFSARDARTKLAICTALEESFLSRFYRIPLVSSSTSVLLSYQIENYTDAYSVMYGFGGFRLLKYHYDDRAWSEYVRDAGGRLKYE